MDNNNNLKIKCPFCGAEYLPGEIYTPSDFFPKILDIVKSSDGKIVTSVEEPLHLEDEYICDVCNHTFRVKATVSFNSEPCEEHDWNYEHTTKLYSENRHTLEEK